MMPPRSKNVQTWRRGDLMIPHVKAVSTVGSALAKVEELIDKRPLELLVCVLSHNSGDSQEHR